VPFLRNVPGLEAVYRDYAPKGVQMFIVYKSIVHPGTNGFVDAYTIEERLQQVALARQRLGTTMPMLSDSLDGAIVTALHAAPNAEFVVDPDGVVVQRRFWHDPKQLRTLLEQRVGTVERPTRVEDLGMKLEFPPAGAPRGLVPRLETPGSMRILQVAPEMPPLAARKGAQPFFAKLLAEGDQDLLRRGTGKLYLGFHLDPIYQVHWNNPAGGLSFSIDAIGDDDKVAFATVTGQTPPYEHEADVDPREFLLDFTGPAAGTRFRVTVRYTICDDKGTFCMPVEQHYTLALSAAAGNASRAGTWMLELVGDPMQWDKNGDGKATRAELPPERAQIILLHFDRNHDEAIDAEEATLFLDMVRLEAGTAGR